MKDPAHVRIGIVGVGNIGSAHAHSVSSGMIENAVLSAVCDISPERRKMCAEKYPGVPFFTDHHEMFRSGAVDAVHIATPHKFHADIAMDALRCGLHVLVEKPEDITVTKAEALNRAAAESGRTFAIMFNQRTNPLFAKAHQIVQSGGLGELVRTDWIITNWYRTQKYYDSGTWRATWDGEGGGVLINQAPHNLDLWQWICGMPCEITAFCDEGKHHRIEVEDEVTVFARYPNGATGVFITSTGENPGTNRLEIVGTRGKIVIENSLLKHWSLSEDERNYCFDPDCDRRKLTSTCFEMRQEEAEPGHRGILQNFVDHILYGEPLLSPGTDGICELTLSNAAYLSSWQGNRKVALPLDMAEFDRCLQARIAQSRPKSGASTVTDNTEYLSRWKTSW